MNATKVRDVMTNLVVTMRPDDEVLVAARRLLTNRISGAPVVDDGKLIGIVSEMDLLTAFSPEQRKSFLPPHPMSFLLMSEAPRVNMTGKKVADVMSRSVVYIGPDENIQRAAALIDRHGVRRLPVVDSEGYVVGIVARSDLVRTLAGIDVKPDAELVP